MSVSFTERH